MGNPKITIIMIMSKSNKNKPNTNNKPITNPKEPNKKGRKKNQATPEITIQNKENKKSPGQGRKERKHSERTPIEHQKPNYISGKWTISKKTQAVPWPGKTARWNTNKNQRKQADPWPRKNHNKIKPRKT